MSDVISPKNKYMDLYEEIRQVYTQFPHPWVVGYSGGKDSTTTLQMIWYALADLPLEERQKPVYVISTNTYDREAGIPPAQNYPRGWLTAALDVVNAESQIVALCWFLDDFPHGDQWDWFSLTQQPGRLVDAAEEFDTLLGE